MLSHVGTRDERKNRYIDLDFLNTLITFARHEFYSLISSFKKIF